MTVTTKTLRTCPKGHRYYKSANCPTCPLCEASKRPANGFMSKLSAPARRSLQNKGIDTEQKLSGYTENEILAFHGVGPSAIPKLAGALAEKGLTFKRQE